MKRCLVTGASGFVGANLVRRLLAEGHEVHLVLREDYVHERVQQIRSHVHVHLADLRDEIAVTTAVQTIHPDWVFHLAAYGAYSWQTDVRRILDTNVIGTANLVQACLDTDFAAFVHAGSSSEYGYKDYPPREDSWLEPNSYYAVSKASATLFCRYTAQKTGRRLHTLRLYSVYGPYEDPNRLVPTLIVKGLENSLPRLVNPGVARDLVYVEDVCAAFVLAASREDQPADAVYNVGTGVQTTIAGVVDVARGELGITEEPRWGSMENRIWDTTTWVCDNTLIKSALGWEPADDFPSGFRKTIAWFKEHPAVVERYTTLLQAHTNIHAPARPGHNEQ